MEKFKPKSKNLSENGNSHNLNANQSLQDIPYNKCSTREVCKPQATGELIFRQEFQTATCIKMLERNTDK